MTGLAQRLQDAGLATLLALVLSVSGVANQPVQAAEISTVEIAESALSTSCLDYQVIGICMWLTCTAWGCYTESSIKVTHYIPELVVSSYQSTGENPWPAVRMMAQPNNLSQAGGTSTDRHSNNHETLRFKNVDAIGHPALATFQSDWGGFLCKSRGKPMLPYFLSTLDPAAWRSNIPESGYPQALTPGVRELGQPGDLWGNIYPRGGFINQNNDYKAGAVAAQRVADVVTRTGQPHVYNPLLSHHDEGYWPPDPVKEGDRSTHRWQPLAPQKEDSCAVWPDRGPMATYQDRRDGSGDNVWAMWRPITCCARRGEELLFDTGGDGWVE
ncbi:TIGR03756 family integrating conjugative element protein [Chromohalobacter japonicus]|uniref:TIGR03756 family integrating conjugative element protein n=1 Tax=Chromohalobacter japonicus TaxID=223900 RepID=UPI001FF38989|nr:TIGR03756 family integrating conjugative element protein [Chromohalobacter japonicus]MCK0753552.1 TIGR03756 family integrating conjugative element protein [Chromohalobacter japonicus]